MDKVNDLDLAIRITKQGVGYRQGAYGFEFEGGQYDSLDFVHHSKVVTALALIILHQNFWYSIRKSNSKYFVCMFRVPNPHHIYETSDPDLGLAMIGAFLEVLECWQEKEESG